MRPCRSSAVLLALACAAVTTLGAAGRSTKQINADLQAVAAEIEGKHFPTTGKYNPAYRRQMAGVYGDLYVRQRALHAEYAAADPKFAALMRHFQTVDDAKLAFWGVSGAQDRLDAQAMGPDKAAATDARLGDALVAWWNAYADADGQSAAVAPVEKLAAAAPTSNDVADTLHQMLITNPASVGVGQRLTDDLTKTMAKSTIGKEYAAVPNKIDEPLAVAGGTLKGPTFKSTAWAGKVVLIDFWATWCPPCREEIPRVAKVYAQYHDQGLEVVGVSSDQDRQTLAAFLKQHPEMPWPEMFQGGTAWHPLTKKFGITGIPAMYLIDRNGNLRTTEAADVMDTLVPALLAETYTPPAKSAGAAKPAAAAKPAGGSTGGLPTDAINGRLHQAAGAGMN